MNKTQTRIGETLVAGFATILVIMLVACSGVQKETTMAPVDQRKPGSLTYLDTDRFDDHLSSMLKDQAPTVTVSFLDPPSVGEMPPRINQWLAAVEENGGTIGLEGQQPNQKSASAVLAVVALLKEGHAMYKESHKFTPTQYYDATVELAEQGETVSRIQFSLREAN